MAEIDANFAALNKGNLEVVARVTRIAVESLERLAKLNAEAARVLFQEAAANAGHALPVKDLNAFSAWNAGLIQSGVNKVLGYSQNVYEIAAQAQTEISELLEQRLLEGNQEAQNWVEAALKSSPVGNTEAAASAAKAAMVNARNVIEGISTAAKQAAGFADANIKAAATATAEAVKGAAK